MTDEERWFMMYLDELKDHGWVFNYVYQPDSFKLNHDYVVHAYVKHKNHNELKEIKLISESVYTADFRIDWEAKAEGVFYWKTGGAYPKGFHPSVKRNMDTHVPFFASNRFTYVDTKGKKFGVNNNSAITFPDRQRIVLLNHGIYVQKVISDYKDEKGFYRRTFYPKAMIEELVYSKNCKYGKKGESKLKFDYNTIEDFVNKRNGTT